MAISKPLPTELFKNNFISATFYFKATKADMAILRKRLRSN